MSILLTSWIAAAAPAVVLVIGDGAGPAQLELASLHAHGRTDALALHAVPHRGRVVTASLDGVTDSAAAATALATGALTRNRRVGLDGAGAAVPSLVELARDAGLATGVVTTTALTHATPAAFTAHARDRKDAEAIAAQQLSSGVDVALGGGAADFRAEDVSAAGYAVVTDAAALAAVRRPPVWGVFADHHLPWVGERSASVPGLAAMTTAAIRLLRDDPDGFLLVVEAGRIDHAGHDTDADRLVPEVLELDAAVRAIREAGLDDLTLVVTADHETGGMRIVEPGRPGVVSAVEWESGDHTNTPVDVFAEGPGAAAVDGALLSHADLHALLRARITDAPPPPVPPIVPDGQLADLPARQVAPDAVFRVAEVRAGTSADGLGLGVAGWFRRGRDGVAVFVDHVAGGGDFSGPGDLSGALADARVVWPHGFAPDLAVVSLGAHPRPVGLGTAGRGLAGARRADGSRVGAAVVFAEDTRHVDRMSTPPPPDRGFEAFVPWTGLWRSGVPDGGATVAVVGVQLRTDAGRVVDARPLGLPLVLTVDGDGALVAVDGEAP